MSTDSTSNSSGFEQWTDSSIATSDTSDTIHTTAADIDAPIPQPKVPVSQSQWKCRASQPEIRWDRVLPGEPLAYDGEWQRYRKGSNGKWRHRMGKVALVNSAGETVVEAYPAYPNEADVVKSCKSKRFGVEPADFLFKNGAVPARKFEAELKAVMKNHPIIVHDKRADIDSFYFEESKDAFSASNGVVGHDTQQMYSYLRSGGQPGLAYATEVVLGREIQGGGGGFHSPVEDAKATMELYLLKFPYDRVAEAEKLKKTQTNRGGRTAKKSIARQEPTLADFVKVKTSQGKAKRAKASAAAVNN